MEQNQNARKKKQNKNNVLEIKNIIRIFKNSMEF